MEPEIRILPYAEGVSPEYLLSWLYEYMREDGLLPLVFPDFKVSLDGWIRFAGATHLHVVFQGEEVVAAFWLYEILPYVRAKIGMFVRRKFWQPSLTGRIHAAAMEAVFYEVSIPLLLASVWTKNRLCTRFLLRHGWGKANDVPNYFGPGKNMALFYKEKS